MVERVVEPLVALVADDHADIRRALSRMLSDAGCEVHAAADGVEAIDFLAEYDVSILLLDLSMPRRDGFAVLREMRERRSELAQPLTLIISANADVDGRIRGTHLGAMDFVDKPFRLPAVRLRIQRMISMVMMERGVGQAEASLERLRMRDPVTGTGTFALLRPLLDAQFQSARLAQRDLTCIVVCDESYNKVLSDEGREAGELRLRAISDILHQQLRGADLVFRIDAAEFVVLLPGTSAIGARRVIEKLSRGLRQLSGSNQCFYFAAASCPHPQILRANQLFRAANLTLAQARSRERSGTAFFDGF